MLKPLVMCAPETMKVTDVTFPLRAMSAALRSFWSQGKVIECVTPQRLPIAPASSATLP